MYQLKLYGNRNVVLSIQSAKPAFSPVVGIGTTPPPSPAGECAPPPFGSGGGGQRGEAQFRRGDIHCGTLYICVVVFLQFINKDYKSYLMLMYL
jgi:hypothetical protein